MKASLIVALLLVAGALAVPTSKSFTTDVDVVELDGSVGQVTWNYDYHRGAESFVHHRAGVPTINTRLYSQQIEFLVIENECYILPLDMAMPTPSERIATLSADKALLRWSNEGPVASAAFAIPPTCNSENLKNGTFCPACLSTANAVVSLGCNATAAEIANLCGAVFSPICKSVLTEMCNGACQVETCAADACCLFDLCSGSTCSGSSSSSSSSGISHTQPDEAIYIADDEVEQVVGDGIFCISCQTVSEGVIGLGCNATSSEIANLCGNMFAPVCKSVLETVCSGVCNIEQCATQSCCLFHLCSGNTCNGSTKAVPQPSD